MLPSPCRSWHQHLFREKLKITKYYDDRLESAEIWYSSFLPNFRKLSESEVPHGVTLGFAYGGMVANPSQFLPWALAKLRDKRVILIRKEISLLEELRELTEQTMLVKCRLTDQVTVRQGSQYTYVIPGPGDGGVIVGGITQPGATHTDIDQEVRPDILQRVNKIAGGLFDWVDLERDVEQDIVAFRPARHGGVRVERVDDTIHAYGAGPLGYLYSFGIAKQVADLVARRDSAKL